MLDTPRRSALRTYLVEVTRELITRGALRMAKGQTIDDVVRGDLPTILREAGKDFKTIGGEMIGGLVQGAIVGLLRR